jgi:hypothetical protein
MASTSSRNARFWTWSIPDVSFQYFRSRDAMVGPMILSSTIENSLDLVGNRAVEENKIVEGSSTCSLCRVLT